MMYKLMMIVVSTMALSGCWITSPRTLPPTVIEVPAKVDTPPPGYLVECPEDLPESGVPEDVWNELTADQQLRIILNVSANWAREYHVCGERQRALVGWAQKIGTKSNGTDTD